MMKVYASTALIAGLGMAVLTGLSFGPNPQSRQVALLIPPWQDTALDQAAATGLAIVDLHWRGHVIILDTGGDPNAVTRLQQQGYWLLDAAGAGLCGTDIQGT